MIINYTGGDPFTPVGKKLRRLTKGVEWVITAAKKEEIRTLSDNRYYWKCCCTVIALYIGDTKEVIHDILKGKFNIRSVEFPNGTVEIVGQSTTILTEKEFKQYIVNVRSWARQIHKLEIPPKTRITNEIFEKMQQEYDLMLNG